VFIKKKYMIQKNALFSFTKIFVKIKFIIKIQKQKSNLFMYNMLIGTLRIAKSKHQF